MNTLYRRTRFQKLKLENKCTECGKENDRNRIICSVCAKKASVISSKYLQSIKINNPMKYQEMINRSTRRRKERPIERKIHRSREETKLKLDIIYGYGGQCTCCGEKEIIFLTIDHINGDGNQHRKQQKMKGAVFYRWLRKNNFPNGFQVLCRNCNWGKYANGGLCPHQDKDKDSIWIENLNSNTQSVPIAKV